MSYAPLDWDDFADAAAAVLPGSSLSLTQIESIRLMIEMLRSYNASASLMSDAALANVLRGHVLDSLTLLPLIRRANLQEGRLVDVGTGGGFPGLVLAIAEPSLHVTLMDATRKKTAYLERVVAELRLDVGVLHARAEDAGRDLTLRESFDVAVCRALGPWTVVLELTLPFCKTGGVLLGQRGSDAPSEVAAHEQTAAILGGRVVGVEQVGVETGLENRHVIVVEKVESTVGRYPRKAGIPAKRPLI